MDSYASLPGSPLTSLPWKSFVFRSKIPVDAHTLEHCHTHTLAPFATHAHTHTQTLTKPKSNVRAASCLAQWYLQGTSVYRLIKKDGKEKEKKRHHTRMK